MASRFTVLSASSSVRWCCLDTLGFENLYGTFPEKFVAFTKTIPEPAVGYVALTPPRFEDTRRQRDPTHRHSVPGSVIDKNQGYLYVISS
jgi:hypothetical protein